MGHNQELCPGRPVYLECLVRQEFRPVGHSQKASQDHLVRQESRPVSHSQKASQDHRARRESRPVSQSREVGPRFHLEGRS